MNKFSVKFRLLVLVGIALLLLLCIGVVGLRSSAEGVERLRSVYEDRTLALSYLTQIDSRLRRNGAEFALALQHDPRNPLAKLHDHPLELHAKALADSEEHIDKHWKAYMATLTKGEEKRLADELDKGFVEYRQNALRPIVENLRKQDFSQETVADMFTRSRNIGNTIRERIDRLIQIQTDEAKKEYEGSLRQYQNTRNFSIAVIVLGLAGLLIYAFWQIRSITGPLDEIRDVVGRVQQNRDFTLRVSDRGHDEIAQTGRAFNDLLAAMRGTLVELAADSAKVGQAAADLATNASQSASAAGDTSESTSAMAAAVEQMTVSINHVGENSREALALASRAGELSTQGGRVIQKAVEEIDLIAQTVRDVSGTIGQLGNHSERISGVIKVIKDVADQTNLLALNAAIEAARAGEAGRGFAVVADEVRKLAERTAQATGEISQMIVEIQSSARNAVGTMDSAVEQVDAGVKLAAEAGEAIVEIREGANRVVGVVTSISDSISEQASASNAIAEQVERVAQAAEENSATARHASESAGMLESLARDMTDSVKRYRT